MDIVVSVVIPVHNREKEILRTLNSVIYQTYTDWECIVVDDGSTDSTVAGVMSYVKNDSRIRCVELEKKSNANVARNVGIKMAKGQYIAMLDSDDEYLPNHIENRIKSIESSKVDGIYGSIFVDNGVSTKTRIARALIENESPEDYIFSGEAAPTPTHFYRKEAIQNVLWNEGFERHQDIDLFIRFSRSFNFGVDPKPTVKVHWRRGQIRNIDFKQCQKVYKIYESKLIHDSKKRYLIDMLKSTIRQQDDVAFIYYKTKLNELPGTLPLSAALIAISYTLTLFLYKLKLLFGRLGP